MPVVECIKPQDRKDLEQKILRTPFGEEKTIIEDVQLHLQKWGQASHQQTEEEQRTLSLMRIRCIVFLIRGIFRAGDENGSEMISKGGVGYVIENEKTLQLLPFTAVVIIRQDNSQEPSRPEDVAQLALNIAGVRDIGSRGSSWQAAKLNVQ